MKWWIIGIMGGLTIVLFLWFIFFKKQDFNGALFGLLALGLAFVGIAFFQPDSIKYGDMELKRLKQETMQLNSQAEDAVRLALETVAMLTWNSGRWGGGGKKNEEIATKLLQELHGKKALEYRYALQHMGVFLTPDDELKQVPKKDVPAGINSPLYERYLKKLSLRK